MGIYIKALLLVALLFLAITFGTQNAESVTLRYHFGLTSAPAPLYLVIYIAIILGIIAGMAIDAYSLIALKRKVKKLEKANASLREELEKTKGETGEGVREEPKTGPTEPEVAQTQPLPSSASVEPENRRRAETEATTPEPGQD